MAAGQKIQTTEALIIKITKTKINRARNPSFYVQRMFKKTKDYSAF